jgi:N-acetylglucosamine-6-phosphate deacetylase
MRTVIHGATCLTPVEELPDVVVVVDEGGTIAAVEPAGAPIPGADRTVDASGTWLVPGLIDVHTHGGGGHDLMRADAATLDGFGRFLARHGVTAYLATTVSAERPDIDAVIDAVASASPDGGARALGVHLEGPYLSHEHRGAQADAQLRSPDPDEYGPWLASGVVRLVTAAPEIDGGIALIDAATSAGVEIAIGHTSATYDETRVAADHGARQATHTFNGMRGLHHREPGAVGCVLTDPRLLAQLIVDGEHVHPAVVDLLVRCKGPQGTILVSDSIVAAGFDDGDYDIGPMRVHVRGGVSRTPEGGLAGSTLTLDAAVRNVRQFTGLPLHDCVAMATLTPARAMGWDRVRGTIEPGRIADLVILSPDLEVLATFVAGDLVHHDPRLEVTL